MVQGIFPFREAKRSDYFYSMIKRGQLDLYWRKVSGSKLSSEFKDLIIFPAIDFITGFFKPHLFLSIMYAVLTVNVS